MALYDTLSTDLNKLLTPQGQLIAPGGQGQVSQMIADSNAAALEAGKPIIGYETFTYEAPGPSPTGRPGSYQEYNVSVPVYGKSEEELYSGLQAEQQRLAGIQQATFEQQQADIAAQLKILEGEKSSLTQAQEDYSNMLAQEAEAKKQAEEQALKDLQISRANSMMANQAGSLQISPAGSTPTTAGTQGFKKRPQQFNPTPYKGLSTIQSGMVNI